jgi:hypothetical protein
MHKRPESFALKSLILTVGGQNRVRSATARGDCRSRTGPSARSGSPPRGADYFFFGPVNFDISLETCLNRYPFRRTDNRICHFRSILRRFRLGFDFCFYSLSSIYGQTFHPIRGGVGSSADFVFVPFTELVVKADFYFNLSKRTTAVERILRTSGPAETNTSGRGDRVGLPGLSDGDEGFYWHSGQKQMVLFLTFRGILGHFSGFVFSATDALPEDEDFGCRLAESEHLRRNWYWIACR